MEPHESEASPDRMRLTIDGSVFDVAYDPEQPGAYHYRRLTGPAPGYGFTVRKSDHARSTTAEHRARIRGFLEEVDPNTGYLKDDLEELGEHDTRPEAHSHAAVRPHAHADERTRVRRFAVVAPQF